MRVYVLVGTMKDVYYSGTCNSSSNISLEVNCSFWNVSGTNILTMNNIDNTDPTQRAAYSCHTIITFLEAIFICYWYRRMYIHVCDREIYFLLFADDTSGSIRD